MNIKETSESMALSPANWKVGTSTSLFRGVTEKDMEECREAGIGCLEVCLFGQYFEGERAEVEQYCRQLEAKGTVLGVEFWSVHLPFGAQLDISNPDSAERKEIIKKLSELMETGAIFKPKKAIIHPSWEPIEGNREIRLEASRESIAELSEQACRLGIQLAVECLPRTCLGNTGSEIRKLITGLDHVGICCDTNHLLMETTEDFIKEHGSRIVTLHVSDYDRVNERHWKPGQGVNNWNAIIEALTAHQYSGPWMFELAQQNPGKPITPADLMECWRGLLTAYENR